MNKMRATSILLLMPRTSTMMYSTALKVSIRRMIAMGILGTRR